MLMRFFEFCDLDLDEDLATALDIKKKALDDQSKIITNRKKALANQKARQVNRATVSKIATASLKSQ